MADSAKFTKPDQKVYSIRKMLTQDRLLKALEEFRALQTHLWSELPDDQYEMTEEIFDTAIASMMAIVTGVDVSEININAEQKGNEDGAENDHMRRMREGN